MIEKLNYDPLKDLPMFEHKVLYDKINELIDVINKLEGEGKLVDFDHVKGGEETTEKDAWGKMLAGEWPCACCGTYLEPTDFTHVICPKCGLRHRFKNGVIQTKGNMMEDYE